MSEAVRRLGLGAAVSVGTAVVFGVVTGLIPNPLYVRMVPRRPRDYLFLGLTAGFLGVYVAQRADSRARDDSVAAVGTVGGILAFGCPVCNVLLVALLGSSTIMATVDPLRPVFGVVAIALLAGLVYARRERVCADCSTREAPQ